MLLHSLASLFVCLSVIRPSICLTIYLPIYPSILSVCLSVCPSVRLSVCLSVCLSLSLFLSLSLTHDVNSHFLEVGLCGTGTQAVSPRAVPQYIALTVAVTSGRGAEQRRADDI